MASGTLLRLQQDFLDFLNNQIDELQAKKDGWTEDFILVLEDDINLNYTEFKERHKDLIGKYLLKKSEAVGNYIDDNVCGTIRSVYLEVRTIFSSKKPKPAARGNETLNTSIIAPPTQHFELRLPVLPLPSFDGNYNEWMSFHSIFTSTVHTSTTLEDIQKLQYLRSSLKGDALNVVKNLELTNDNYLIARKLLMERYHHPRRLVNAYLRKLYEYPVIKTESAANLKQFLDNVNDCQVALEALESNSNDYHFIYHMMKKLPIVTATGWEEKLGSSKELQRLTDFKQFIENRFRVLEMTEIPEKENKASTKSLVTKNIESSKPKNSKGKGKDGKNFKTKPCVLCLNKYHLLYSCFKFQGLSIQEKWHTVRNHNQCVNCLGNNHNGDQCKSTFSCKVCQGRHHTLLHVYDTTQSEIIVMQPSATTSSTLLTLEDNNPLNSFLTSSRGDNTNILGTAKANIFNHLTGKQASIRVLIDPCSEISYIVDPIVQALDLHRARYCGQITAFGGVTAGEIDHLVQFKLKSIHSAFEFQVTAAVTNCITGDLPSQSVSLEEFHVPSDLPLADPAFNFSGPIHVLLGVDPTAQIKERGIFRISSTLIAQKTKLGFVVEGEVDYKQGTRTSSTFMTQTMAKKLNDQIERFWRIEEFCRSCPLQSRGFSLRRDFCVFNQP